MNEEYAAMFETLMDIIECKVDLNDEWEPGNSVNEVLDQADILLRKARGN